MSFAEKKMWGIAFWASPLFNNSNMNDFNILKKAEQNFLLHKWRVQDSRFNVQSIQITEFVTFLIAFGKVMEHILFSCNDLK